MSNNDEGDWRLEFMGWLLNKMAIELAAREAMKFVECMRSGKSFEECHGIFRAAPFPPPGDPSLDEKLNKLSVKERREALLFIKKEFLARVEMIDEKLKNM